ncbi:Hypothetical protein NTJ_10135 [Nesidiocoris tenuis]|uniref:Uncharacterized protein n=1 Tax=Nesidiocoris tenuis TaxID=355587 RepID=A0ABN7B2E2_9HEMI|nr:Hypothetical protein NTJ_10135 [Nesidiocoris tenuis]
MATGLQARRHASERERAIGRAASRSERECESDGIDFSYSPPLRIKLLGAELDTPPPRGAPAPPRGALSSGGT